MPFNNPFSVETSFFRALSFDPGDGVGNWPLTPIEGKSIEGLGARPRAIPGRVGQWKARTLRRRPTRRSDSNRGTSSSEASTAPWSFPGSNCAAGRRNKPAPRRGRCVSSWAGRRTRKRLAGSCPATHGKERPQFQLRGCKGHVLLSCTFLPWKP